MTPPPSWAADATNKTKVLLITGGHGFEKEPFLKVFEENTNITFTITFGCQEARRLPSTIMSSLVSLTTSAETLPMI